MANQQGKQNKKERFSSKVLQNSKQKKWLALILVVAFVAIGIFIIYTSFAAGIPVFKDNAEYWRPRIGQCESGMFYQNKKNPNYRGAYQFGFSTWKGAVGLELAAQYPDPADAPPEIQDLGFYNLFARRGTQPWNASYHCWIKGATVPGGVDDQISSVANLPAASKVADSPPAKPFGITSGSYNVIVNGRVTLNDVALPNVVIAACSADRTVTTDAEGRFSFAIPVSTAFCLRPQSGIPEGAVLARTANNVEHSKDVTFENQIAGVDCYKQFWCFLSPSYTWDRAKDIGYNFFYTKP